MAGGAPAGTAMGTGLSANGTNGNGIGLSGCFDAVWARSVRDHIGRFFFYPVRAWREHATGAVMVHMTVRRNGKLNKLDVLESSGNTILDKAATDIVRNAVPLPRIPYRMHVDQVDAKMLIAFGPPVTDHPTADSCGR
jgi:TonB family protein